MMSKFNVESCDTDCVGLAIQNRMDEYRGHVLNEDGSIPDDDDEIIRRLMEECGWLDRSAHELLRMTKYYGAFLLRHALALANILEIEDGDGGF